jgi:CRP-like cAMP-binding protein
VESLPNLRMFKGVSRDHLAGLVAAGDVRTFAAGDVVVHEGDDADAAWLVLTGRLQACVGENRRSLGDLWAGEVFGERALFGRTHKRSATVVSTTESSALRLGAGSLDQFSGNSAVAALQIHLIEVTARRLKTVDLSRRKAWSAEDRAAYEAKKAASPTPDPESVAEGLFARLKRLLGGEP